MLRNGIKVKILWGFGSKSDTKRAFSHDFIKMLKARYKKFGDLFVTCEGNTHEKIILCDEDCFVEGSFNFGSFGGDYTSQTRDESMSVRYDAATVSEIRKKTFDFKTRRSSS